MNEFNTPSPYWLSPGIDVPTREELLPGFKKLHGFYVARNAGEATFVPTEDFMRECPLWRIDVLDDILEAMQRTRIHAVVAFFRECQAQAPRAPMPKQMEVFRRMCRERDIALPHELEALLVLDQQFGGVRDYPRATSDVRMTLHFIAST